MSEHALVTLADVMRQRSEEELARKVGRIADKRAAVMVREFRRRFPRRTLRVVFGNGSEYCTINGRALTIYGSDGAHRGAHWHYESRLGVNIGPRSTCGRCDCLQFVADGLADIVAICGGYSVACPSDVLSEPKERA